MRALEKGLLIAAAACSAATPQARPNESAYVGAETCRACHPAQFARQSVSEHARALFRVGEHPLAASFAPRNELLRPPRFRFQFRRAAGDLRVRAFDDDNVMDLPIEWAFGAGDQAVTFVTRVNEDWYLEHYFSYYARKGSLDVTPGQRDLKPDQLPSAMGLLYKTLDPDSGIKGCFECHSTGPVEVDPDRGLRPAMAGVHCEACHGPGSRHVQSGSARQIDNPKRLSAAALNHFCGRCHRPPGPSSAVVDWNYSWNVRHQPVYLSQSRCFRNSGGALSCLTCHDPHQSLRRGDPVYYRERCTACHSARSRPTAAACGDPASADCVDCHMPRVSPQPYLRFTNHWIGVYGEGAKLKPRR